MYENEARFTLMPVVKKMITRCQVGNEMVESARVIL